MSISHIEQVRAYFDDNYYLEQRRFDIRLRAETVSEFTQKGHYRNALDIGCGDGSISLPILSRCDHLTLVDLSEKMLERAVRRIPPDGTVELLCGDAMNLELARHGYDLILCIGVLAHVDSPEALLHRLAELLAPGGTLILELTDRSHPAGKAVMSYQRLLGTVKHLSYSLNAVHNHWVITELAQLGLTLRSSYRYCFPPPGSQRVLSHDQLYRAMRLIFGDVLRNRNSWLGNEYIHAFRSAE